MWGEAHRSPSTSTWSPLWKFYRHPFGASRRLHYIGMIDEIICRWRLNAICSPLLLPRGGVEEEGGKTKSTNLLITWLALLATHPHPWVLSKSYLVKISKGTFIMLRTFRGF